MATAKVLIEGGWESVSGEGDPVTEAELAAAVAAEATLARNADNLTSGTVADGRIASTIARDSEVTSAVGAEATTRANADTALDGRLDIIEALDPVADNDPRLTDARTPTAHATSHQDGGADELALDGSQITTGTVADARIAATIARDSEVTSAVSAEATARDAAIEAHRADTTNVHGITDTSALETTTGAQAKVDAAVAALLDSAPGALDTLNELAAALGDDAAFSTTVTNALAGKQPLDADLTALAGLSPSNDDVVQRKAGAWTNRTPVQLKTDLSLAKGDVGLGNVDNTSDANKPVSTAQQTALDLKANANNAVLTGTVTVPDGALAIADTNGLQTALDAKLPLAGGTLTGALGVGGSTTVDTVDAWLAVYPTTNHAGIVVELPDTAYGTGPYTDGEFPFVVAEEGAGDLTEQSTTGAALFRIDSYGGLGSTGSLHVATGMRKATGATACAWIQPFENIIPLTIQAGSTDGTGATAFQVAANGQVLHGGGSTGVPGITFVGDTDTGLANLADGVISFLTNGTQRGAFSTTVFSLADGINMSFGTTTGTKIGTGGTQKIGFYGVAPVSRQAGVAVTAAAIHTALVNLGLINT